MQVTLSERVERVLNTLSRDDRHRADIWFGYLRNWEEDSFVRSRSVALNVQGQPVYMFRTSTDLRIFFTLDPQNNTLNVVDIATKDTILSYGNVATGAL